MLRRSITYKIIFSHLLVILIALVFIGTFFSLTARRYVEQDAKNRIIKDAKALESLMKKNDVVRLPQMVKNAVRYSRNTNSQLAILTADYRIVFPRNLESGREVQETLLSQLKGELGDQPAFLRASLTGQDYITYAHPVKAENSGKLRGWILFYTPVEAYELNRGLFAVLFISLLFTGMVAVVCGVFFSRSIARPIIQLKKRTERLSKRDFDSTVEIYTGDELEELAFTVNRMARELKEYDSVQKKFLQNASHELKTPLMSIQGYAEGMKDGMFEDNTHALDIIIEESARLKKIVDEVIYLSKLETAEGLYHMQEGSLLEMLDKSIEKIESLAMKNGIRILRRYDTDVILRMDGDKLIQACINVLGNCTRYARSEITVQTRRRGKWVEILISDDGEGFAREDMEHIFERFYKGKKGNTGLGLAIARVIIEKHGGTIMACNREHGGAEFSIALKLPDDSEKTAEE